MRLPLSFFLCAALALPALAQTPPASTPQLADGRTLAQSLKAAGDNLDVSIARHAVAAAQADVQSADHAPAPVLSAKLSSIDLQNGIGGGNLIRDKRIDKAVGVDWTWERGAKRDLRTQAARLGATAAALDLEDTRVQQQLAAQAAFFDLLAAQERLLHVTDLEKSAAQLARTAERRVRAGDLSAQDGARADIEAERARADLQSALLERQRATLVLGQLTGFAPGGLTAAADWPVLPASGAAGAAVDEAAALDARADVRAAAQRVQAMQAALELALAQKKADITLGASLDHFPGTSNRLVELRMQMPLQGLVGSYNYQGEVARAQALLAQSQDQLDKTRRVAQADLSRLRHEIASAAQRSASHETAILPRARQVAAMAELAYSRGALSLTELIDARRTLRTALLDAVNTRADHAKATVAWSLRTQTTDTLARR